MTSLDRLIQMRVNDDLWKSMLQILDFAVLRRDFQRAQEILKREVLRQRLIAVDYRFGQGETTQFLGNWNALNRQKVETFKHGHGCDRR